MVVPSSFVRPDVNKLDESNEKKKEGINKNKIKGTRLNIALSRTNWYRICAAVVCYWSS